MVGAPGSGKTALIRHIALQLEPHYQIVPIFRPQDITKYDDSNIPKVFLMDDVLGIFSVDRSLVSELERYNEVIRLVLDMEKRRSKLFMSCRLSIYNEAKELNLALFEKNNIVNLDSEENDLSKDDREGIFESHSKNAKLNITLDVETLQQKSNFLFPLLCKLFCKDEQLRKYGSDFFQKPYQCLFSEMDHIQTKNRLQYSAMVLCMLHNNSLSEAEPFNADILLKVYRSCRVKGNPQNWEIFEQLVHLSGTYITQNKKKLHIYE